MPFPLFPNGETVVLHRRVPQVVGGERQYDDYGNLVLVESTVTLTGVVIWPNTTTEVLQAVDRTNTTITMAMQATVDIDAVDYVTWRGKDYEAQGEVERYRNPHTGTAMQTVLLDRVEG